MSFNFKRRDDAEAAVRIVRSQMPRDRQWLRNADQSEVGAMIVEIPAAGIAARSGTTAGSAECTPYYIDDSGELTEWTRSDGTSTTVTVYNLATSTILGGSGVYGQAKRVGGKLVFDVEYC